MKSIFSIILGFSTMAAAACDWLLPVDAGSRLSMAEVRLTSIGMFGIKRIARPAVEEHLHTGIDICRPREGFGDDPIFAVSCGTVVSVRSDGPYAQIIIHHPEKQLWSVYEHISSVCVHPGNQVTPDTRLAAFMSKEELDRYGMKFNHLHFEILRTAPKPLAPTRLLPERFYGTYGLDCRNEQELQKHYLNPIDFFKSALPGSHQESGSVSPINKQDQ